MVTDRHTYNKCIVRTIYLLSVGYLGNAHEIVSDVAQRLKNLSEWCDDHVFMSESKYIRHVSAAETEKERVRMWL